MTTYSSYPMPCHGYPGVSYYSTFYSTTPAPGYPSHEMPDENSYGPPPESYAYYRHSPPITRPATAFPSMRPHSTYTSEAMGREREFRDLYKRDKYEDSDIEADEFHIRFSPRFNSNGQYATASAYPCRRESRAAPRRMRSFSASYPIPGIDSDDENRYDEYNSTESKNPTYHHECKAPRRPKKKSYNYRGQGCDNSHHYTSQTYISEEEEEEHEERQRNFRNRERPHKHKTRSSSAAPRRPNGVNSASHRERKRHQATEEDRCKYKFPSHYSMEFWDPTESPIILLGNVFDANSLGKWVYDWTVSCYGSGSTLGKMAGELWLLLIQLAGKVKRAEECLSWTRSEDAKELLQDFILSGERLNRRLCEILKLCEKPMLSVSEIRGKSYRLGMNAGIVFVETIFGQDRLFFKTEKLMHSMRLWNLRFDANCGEILRSLRTDN
ncbi:hypothetical protein EPUL_001474 [Erysiphe pulchra]|uniref:Vegetative cell wall protein gp1 n=1 Tax=Erysiphe pulchra TaxID=225359 RepID=A0A2S4PX69_9PEZI|nr:hypothetical protein EPUL_001474 [Erysiphe pulchra]